MGEAGDAGVATKAVVVRAKGRMTAKCSIAPRDVRSLRAVVSDWWGIDTHRRKEQLGSVDRGGPRRIVTDALYSLSNRGHRRSCLTDFLMSSRSEQQFRNDPPVTPPLPA